MDLEITVAHDISTVPAAEWDRLVGSDNPFVEHAFLAAMESSGSVSASDGWGPCHLLIRSGSELVGAAPLYVKGHSYGEYIFDWSWANAAAQMGLAYYPKLVCAVPFTPATGPRLLVAPGIARDPVVDAIVAGMRAMADHVEASSIHVLFCTASERDELEARGLLPRVTCQYHWTNDGYEDFEDYLSHFRASARRKVRKERREAASAGLDITTHRGGELSDEDIAATYAFYRDTTGRKGAIPYPQWPFFQELNRSLADRAVITLARRDGTPVAGALSFEKGSHLYGRYWGCLEDYDKLHFELCYYRHIAWAIEQGHRRFEAGAQGEHKIKRGLMPSETCSAHWLREPGLARAVADYLPREAAATTAEMEWLRERGPFRR